MTSKLCAMLVWLLAIGLAHIVVPDSLAAEVSDDSTGSNQFTDNLDNAIPESDFPIVLTATRLKQPQAAAPASVSVIDRDMIEASGSRTIVELLRLVPGVQVGYERAHVPEVGIHGFGGSFSRRIQVLVDGRSIYKPGLSRVLWNDLPLHIDDIARIEVIRGPNSASYGANSFSGVVNIITSHPDTIHGTEASVTGGNNGVRDFRVRNAGRIGSASYRVTAARLGDDGFQVSREGERRFDKHDSTYLNIDLEYADDVDNQIRFQAGFSDGDKQIDNLDDFEALPYHDAETRNAFAQITWERSFSADHQIRVQAYHSANDAEEDWQTCIPTIFLSDELGQLYNLSPEYTSAFVDAATSGGTPPPPPSTEIAAQAALVLARFANNGNVPACGFANQDFEETRTDIELQDTFQINDTMRLLSGISLRRDTIEGETFFSKERRNYSKRLFANFEWYVQPDIVLNLGAMHEHDKNIGDEISPRIAMNYLMNNKNSLRLVLSEATRTPDFYEQESERSYRIRNLQPPVNAGRTDGTFYVTPVAPGNLDAERIVSREIGWFHEDRANHLQWDVKVYRDDLFNLVSGLNGLEDFAPVNDGRATVTGLDLQLRYQPTEKLSWWFTYAHIDIDSESGQDDEDSAPQDSSSLLVNYSLDSSWSLSGAYYYMSQYFDAPDYQRLDLRARKSFAVNPGIEAYLELVAQHRLDDNYYFDTDNNYRSDTFFYLQAGLRF